MPSCITQEIILRGRFNLYPGILRRVCAWCMSCSQLPNGSEAAARKASSVSWTQAFTTLGHEEHTSDTWSGDESCVCSGGGGWRWHSVWLRQSGTVVLFCASRAFLPSPPFLTRIHVTSTRD